MRTDILARKRDEGVRQNEVSFLNHAHAHFLTSSVVYSDLTNLSYGSLKSQTIQSFIRRQGNEVCFA